MKWATICDFFCCFFLLGFYPFPDHPLAGKTVNFSKSQNLDRIFPHFPHFSAFLGEEKRGVGGKGGEGDPKEFNSDKNYMVNIMLMMEQWFKVITESQSIVSTIRGNYGKNVGTRELQKEKMLLLRPYSKTLFNC